MPEKSIEEELEHLRAFKASHEGKAINRAFARLEQLLDSGADPIMSVRAFRTMSECLICIKEIIDERR